MTKLQPNFSFQSYQEDSPASKKQFIYQLQTLFTNVSNSVNATIDDESYFSKERITGFTWIDGSPIYTKTVNGVVSGNATLVPHGITDIQLFTNLSGILITGVPISGGNFCVPIPNASTSTSLNIFLAVDDNNVTVDLNGPTWMGSIFYITLQYIKVRNA